TGDTEAASHLGRHVRLREAAFEMEPIARIIVDMSGVVSMINDRMRADFGVDRKDVGKPLQDLEISYRPTELRSLMERARAERRLVTAPRVERRLADGSSQYFDIDVGMLATNGGAQIGYSISFLDITQFSRLQGDLERSNE